MKILIVEDQPDHLKLAHEVLKAEGHEVTGVAGASEAWSAIEQNPPHVILMDLSLPGVDGLSLARQLKANPATSRIHIVAVTAYPEQWSRSTALDAGCEAFLLKPINIRSLGREVTAVVKEDSCEQC